MEEIFLKMIQDQKGISKYTYAETVLKTHKNNEMFLQ